MSTDDRNEGSHRFTDAAALAQNSPMAEEAQQAVPEAEAAPLVFEQPLNERMRTFLRLDFLYSQALYHNEMQSSGAAAPPWAACSTSSPSPRAATCAPTCRRSSSATSRSSTCSRASPASIPRACAPS